MDATLTRIESVRTPTGVCDLYRDGDDYVMTGWTGYHTLRVADTPRVDAHWTDFLGNNGGRLGTPPTVRPWKDIKADMAKAIADARATAEEIRRTGIDAGWWNRRAQVRSREAEILGGRGPACDRIDDSSFVAPSKLTYKRVRAEVARFHSMGATDVSLEGGFDIVHDPFNSGSDYEPRVSEWCVTLTIGGAA
jgi:hypothetical protein